MKHLLEAGVNEGVFPGAVLLVARDGEILFLHAEGRCSSDPREKKITRDTIFDLASLTKPLATTLAFMRLADRYQVDLDQSLNELVPVPVPGDKIAITPRLLLCHSAGFRDWIPFYLRLTGYDPGKRKTILRELIMEAPLAYGPGEMSLYSDPGFMILEWIIEEVSGITLEQFVEQTFYTPLMLKNTFLMTEPSAVRFNRDMFAATEDCPWRGRVIRGEVHDENAFALGGYSGHAGLFGTAGEVYRIVNLLRGHYRGERNDYFSRDTVMEFFRRQGIVEGSTWALGWDTPSFRGSSSGRFFSSNSVGHLGFSGTSVWMDLEKDVIVILLTNRVNPTRNNRKIRAFRPKLHDEIMRKITLAQNR